MAAIAFDTLKFVEKLEAGGFTPMQAKAAAQAFAEATGEQLATKADIVSVKTDIAELKADILKWMFGSIAVQTVIIIGTVIKLTGKG